MKRRRKDSREKGKKGKGREEGERNIIIHINATSTHWTKRVYQACFHILLVLAPQERKNQKKSI